MVTIERSMQIAPVIDEAEQIVKSATAVTSPGRFSDPKLGKWLGVYIAVQRDYYSSEGDARLVDIIMKHAIRDVRSTKRVRQALEGITNELRWNHHPSQSVKDFIELVTNQKPNNINLKGGV